MPPRRRQRRATFSGPRRARRGLRLAATVLAWLLAVPPLLAAIGIATHGRFDVLEPNALAWLADLAATLWAHAIACGLGCVLLTVLTRRLVAGLVSVLSVVVLVVAALGVDRAPASASPKGPVVSVLAVNAWAGNQRGDEQLEIMLASGADLIMLNESSGSLLRAIRSDPRVREVYPHFRLPDRAGPGFRFVLSRHPLRRGGDAFGFVWPEIQAALGYHGQRVLRVDLPAGPFVFAGVQFRSPRSPSRWAAGNAQADDTARGIAMIAERTRLPIIAAGDLNATPVGVRMRRFTQSTGLLIAKPALRAGGTYPSSLPRAARVPIDGGLVSPGVSVVSYRTIEMPGSDHAAALMVFELPGVRTGGGDGRRDDDAATIDQAAGSSDSP
ncbi:MAG: endonuclease/exonuclease/phosphatase family protein [Planctomycetota bacterium]